MAIASLNDRLAAADRIVAEPSIKKAVAAERERCRAIASRWLSADHIRLHAGEMTAQELRSVRAVVAAIRREIVGQ